MLDIKVKGQCVHSKLDGSPEELLQELVMLNISVINHIVKNLKLKQGGKLADLAPTMLDLMNLEKPEEMTGESLLDRE